MGQRTNLLLQIEGRSGARLNRVYHLQWGYRKKLPMAFLHLLSSRYFRPDDKDIFAFFPRVLNLNGLDLIDCQDWSKYDFNKLKDCQEALGQCDNNNGAMVVIVKEHKNEYTYPNFNVGFLLGPEKLEAKAPSAGGSAPRNSCSTSPNTMISMMTSSPTRSMPSLPFPGHCILSSHCHNTFPS